MTTVNFNINARASGDWQAIREGEKAVFELKTQINGVLAMVKSGALLQVGAQISKAFAAIPRGINEAVRSGVAFNANLEQQTIALKTLTGSMTVAQARMRELVEFTARTPFQFQEVVNANRLLVTFGGLALATEDTLRMVGDAAAASGRGFEDVAMWVGRLYVGLANGAPVGQATMRLLEMGVISAQAKSELEALASSAQGHAGAQQILARVLAGTTGAMIEQAVTASGLYSTFKDGLMLIKAEGFEPVFHALKEALQGFLAAMQDGAAIDSLRVFGVLLSDLVSIGAGVLRFTLEWARWLGLLAAALGSLALGMMVSHIAAWIRSVVMAIGATQTKTVALGGLSAALQRTIFYTSQATGAFGRLAAAGRAAGLSLRAAFLANPLGIVVTVLTTIASLVYLWFSRQRAVSDEVRKTREENQRLRDAWPARLADLTSEVEQKRLVRDLTEEIKLLESQPRLNAADREKLMLLRSQRSEAELITAADHERNRALAAAARLRGENREQARARLDALTAPRPRTRAEQMAGIEEQLSGIPAEDPAALREAHDNLLAEEERYAQRLAALRGDNASQEALSAEAIVAMFGTIASGEERLISQSHERRLEALQAQMQATREQISTVDAQIAQAAERLALEQRLNELQEAEAAEQAERMERLSRLSDLHLRAEEAALEASWDARTVGLEDYYAQRAAFVEESGRRELAAAEALADAEERAQAVATAQLRLETARRNLATERIAAETDAAREALDLQAQLVSSLRETLRLERQTAEARGDARTANEALVNERSAVLDLAAAYEELAAAIADPDAAAAARARAESLRQEASNLRRDRPVSLGEGLDDGLSLASMETMGERLRGQIVSIADSLRTSIGGALEGLITRTMSWGDALRSVAVGFGQSMLRAITDMAAHWVVSQAVMLTRHVATKSAMFATDQAFAAKGLALQLATAAKSLVAWIPSAIAASISSFGLSAAIGVAAVVAALAAFGGFMNGGYTGAGAPDEPAGIVHRGEFVIPKDVVDQTGPGYWAAMMSNPEIPVAPDLSFAGSAGSTAASAPAADHLPRRMVVVDDRLAAERLSRDPNFETMIIDMVRRNRADLI